MTPIDRLTRSIREVRQIPLRLVLLSGLSFRDALVTDVAKFVRDCFIEIPEDIKNDVSSDFFNLQEKPKAGALSGSLAFKVDQSDSERRTQKKFRVATRFLKRDAEIVLDRLRQRRRETWEVQNVDVHALDRAVERLESLHLTLQAFSFQPANSFKFDPTEFARWDSSLSIAVQELELSALGLALDFQDGHSPTEDRVRKRKDAIETMLSDIVNNPPVHFRKGQTSPSAPKARHWFDEALGNVIKPKLTLPIFELDFQTYWQKASLHLKVAIILFVVCGTGIVALCNSELRYSVSGADKLLNAITESRSNGDFGAVEEHLKRLYKIQCDAFGKNDRRCIGTLQDIALTQAEQNKFFDSENSFALALQQAVELDDRSMIARIQQNAGNLFITLCKYREAESYLTKALQTQRELSREPNHEIVGTLSSMAHLYGAQGDRDKEESYLRQALDAAQHASDATVEDLASILKQLAILNRQKDQWEEAEGNLDRALDLQKRALGPDHPSVANTLIQIATLQRLRGNSDICSALLDQAREICLKRGDDRGLADVYESLGNLYVHKQDFHAADDAYEKCFVIRKRILPPNHSELSLSLYNMAVSKHRQGDLKNAEALLQQSIAKAKRLPIIRNEQLGQALFLLSDIYETTGDEKRRTECELQALKTGARRKPNVEVLYEAPGFRLQPTSDGRLIVTPARKD